MSAVVRRDYLSRGTLVAIGFPTMLLLCVGSWVWRHGFTVGVAPVIVVAFALVCAGADRIQIVLTPRVTASAGGIVVVAAGLVGGPLVGALAGVATETLSTDLVWRRRSTWAAQTALTGFVAGVIGHTTWVGAGGATVIATEALLATRALNIALGFLVALERKIPLGEWSHAFLRSLVDVPLSLPVLAVFLLVFRSAPLLAFPELVAVLVIVALAHLIYGRIVRQLAAERLRARRDALTGAPNRRALAEALAAEEARVRRGTQPAGVLFIDLDLFRDVNNTYGYMTGDKLLVAVYERLREGLRASDTVFRWGGEEFVVLAPELRDEETLATYAERTRALISSAPLADPALTLTASLGGVLLTESRSAQEALELASRLVRIAKQTRNTTVTRVEEVGFVFEQGASPIRRQLASS